MENDKKQISPEELDKVSGGEVKIVLTGQDAKDYMRQHQYNGYSGGYHVPGYSGGWY